MNKQVIDSSGNVVDGLFRGDDGSLTINNSDAYRKSKIQHEKFASLNDEINGLKEQVNKILEKLNG